MNIDDLQAMAASRPRVRPKAAAELLGVHPRTLENWRRSWRRANEEKNSRLRNGPRFYKAGKGVFYEKLDIEEWQASGPTTASGLLPSAAAKKLGVSMRTLEDWRRTWRYAEQVDKPELRKGPAFGKFGKRVWYTALDLAEFLELRNQQPAPRDADNAHKSSGVQP